MLHELLFALAGHPGEVFIKTADRLEVSPHFPYLHASEREALNEILQVANAYYDLADFVNHWQSPFLRVGADHQQARSAINLVTPPMVDLDSHAEAPLQSEFSLYLNSFQRAIQRVILDPYEAHIVDLESRILREEEFTRSATPLSYVRSETEPFHALLTRTLNLVREIQVAYTVREDSTATGAAGTGRGARILDVIRRACDTGIPVVARAMREIYHDCAHVLWNHVIAWTVYGTLVDPSDEFFVVSPTTPSSGNRNGIDPAAESQTAWHGTYLLDETRVPAHMPLATAQSIMFIGKVVATFSGCQGARTYPDTPANWIIGGRANSHHDTRSAAGGHNPQGMNSSTPRPLGSSRHLTALQALRDRNVFLDDTIHCHPTFHDIRVDVTRWLWRDLQIGAQLQSNLRDFRRFFLLGQGDLWCNLLDLLGRWGAPASSDRDPVKAASTGGVSSKVASFANLRRDREVRALLPLASAGTASEHDPALDCFTLQVAPLAAASATEAGQRNGDSTGGGNIGVVTPSESLQPFFYHHRLPLQLAYRIPWPLDLLLTYTADIVGYQRIFAQLITLQRTQRRAHRVSALICSLGRRPRPRPSRSTSVASTVSTTSGLPGRPGTAHGRIRPAAPPATSAVVPAAAQDPVELLVYQLRWQMLQWLDGLTAYYQVDIIDHAHRTLLGALAGGQGGAGRQNWTTDDLQSTDPNDSGNDVTPPTDDPTADGDDGAEDISPLDLNDFQSLHATYLGYLERGLLLRSPPLYRAVHGALQTCESICGAIDRWLTLKTGPGIPDVSPTARHEFEALRATEAELYRTLQEHQKTLGGHIAFLFRSLRTVSTDKHSERTLHSQFSATSPATDDAALAAELGSVSISDEIGKFYKV
ncbi:hypothetical protein IWQ60_010757 [Tieghemiomyces parasiticus]|uniref:Spindle pole body component n=1 Tax=Tieghemiomyces parasiticus TaxID=78921 RepID=A0A9W7ZS66_9FUNG|nr:hypothetical protein IWQ60_010757 [Tieghemiomyces parasiticus]